MTNDEILVGTVVELSEEAVEVAALLHDINNEELTPEEMKQRVLRISLVMGSVLDALDIEDQIASSLELEGLVDKLAGDVLNGKERDDIIVEISELLSDMSRKDR